MLKRISAAVIAAWMFTVLVSPQAVANDVKRGSATAGEASDASRVHYRYADIDGVKVFYREAGAANAPVIVLLHGFPSSSHMFRNLIPELARRYRVIAPDYPGFGHSDAPDRGNFAYTFANLTDVTRTLLKRLNAEHYALYVMDYGAPIGLRLALADPQRVTALVVQNGNAYQEGLQKFWDPLRANWNSNSKESRERLREATTLAATRAQYQDGVRDVSRLDPSAWLHDQALLDRPGRAEIHLDLFYDYRTNVDLYPRFHQFFRDRQPPTLIVWGRNDSIFASEGAQAYLRDLPKAELHLLDTGHFALEDKGEEIARLMVDFLGRAQLR